MNRRNTGFFDPNFIALVFVFFMILMFFFRHVYASEVRTVRLTQTMVARIQVTPGKSTVLSFPSKPTKVILGNQGVFAIEYVENDLAVAALAAHSRSNLFVYLEGRRFAFDLVAVPSGGDAIVLVRDAPPDEAKKKPVKPKGRSK
jgi:hypothetical protein